MPPRYAYWTILVDGQPTAFRAGMQDDLMPTFKRLKEKHPSAEMKWFQNGQLWSSRVEAQQAMRERGERGRAGDVRQGGFRDRKRVSSRPQERTPREPRDKGGNIEWKPKGEFTPAPKRADRPTRAGRPEWKPKGVSADGRDRGRLPDQRRGSGSGAKLEWQPKGAGAHQRSSPPAQRKLDWTPKSGHTGAKPAARSGEKRKWIPKEEYKKAQGVAPRRDKNWRPGGEHKDPRQKYKDAKKAKWQRFKKAVRTRWESKQGSQPPKRRRDDEES